MKFILSQILFCGALRDIRPKKHPRPGRIGAAEPHTRRPQYIPNTPYFGPISVVICSVNALLGLFWDVSGAEGAARWVSQIARISTILRIFWGEMEGFGMFSKVSVLLLATDGLGAVQGTHPGHAQQQRSAKTAINAPFLGTFGTLWA